MASAKPKTAITPTRAEDYPEWYQQVVKAADLAENSDVRGCMIIKPWGYQLWENIRGVLDKMFRDTGHKNAYFPLFIPLSFLEKEAKHVEGFAKECAVVTHHRLEAGPDGKLVPSGKLEEPLIVRPTSETIIGAAFARWVQSYRDLPLLINQWANVVRWEMRPRLFLRTSEFLWQEGHTCHATEQEAREETDRMLGVYADFAENYMAMPVLRGRKTESERFPGAVDTLTIEAMMQDRRALQAGTSHFLGQNFSRASEICFQDEKGNREHAWTTSWGVSTRLVGALVMAHGDDDGLVLPPRLAPSPVVIVPIVPTEDQRGPVMEYCGKLQRELKALSYDGRPLEVELDARDLRGGDKLWSWVKKGVPVRLEVGPRDLPSDVVAVGRRDKPARDRVSMKRAELVAWLPKLLDEIQAELFRRAKEFREQNTRSIDSAEEFRAFFTPKGDEIHGGFARCHWGGDEAALKHLTDTLKVSIRCIELDAPEEPGTCPFSGKPSSRRVVFAKAY